MVVLTLEQKEEILARVHDKVSLNEDERVSVCTTILEHVRNKTPKKSGKLVESMRLQKGGEDDEYDIYALVYFHFLDKGTKDHWIFPRYAKALRWVDELGNVCFSKGHMVSGIVAMHIIDEDELSTLLKEKVLEIIKNKIR